LKAISVNLASRPFYNHRLYLVVYAVCAGILVGMTGLNLYSFTANQIALGKMDEARQVLEREMAGLERQEARVRRELDGISIKEFGPKNEFARRTILQRVFSWTLLFNRLEQLQPPDVKLRSIRPTIAEQGIFIQVVGMAKTPGAITDFEEALIASPLFSEVYPHTEGKQPRGMSFDLSFRYLPARAAEAAATARSEPAPDAAGEAKTGGAP
jgi:Tfp pilus assembly protein PilN